MKACQHKRKPKLVPKYVFMDEEELLAKSVRNKENVGCNTMKVSQNLSRRKPRTSLKMEDRFTSVDLSHPGTTRSAPKSETENLYKNFMETKRKMDEIIKEKKNINQCLKGKENTEDLTESLQKTSSDTNETTLPRKIAQEIPYQKKHETIRKRKAKAETPLLDSRVSSPSLISVQKRVASEKVRQDRDAILKKYEEIMKKYKTKPKQKTRTMVVSYEASKLVNTLFQKDYFNKYYIM